MKPDEGLSPEQAKQLRKQNKRLERRVRQLERQVRTSENMARQSRKALERSLDGLQERTRDLERAKQAAEAGLAAKDRFLATMSHEIRTPMNGVIGCIDLIATTDLVGEQHELVRTLQGSAETLMVLLNDVLDFAKIQGGHMTVETRPFDLAALVHGVVQLGAASASAKGLELAITLAEDTPARVAGDSHRLRQVLNNLVSNAIKFTQEGSVTLCVSVEPEALSAEIACAPDVQVPMRFTVQDTGIGMEPEVQARIFSAFTQADETTTRRFGGTGLGLAISEALVTAMGGTLEVESRPGVGSEFSFTIPMGEAPVGLAKEPSLGASAEAPAAPRRLGRARVLQVDDNPVNRTVAAKMITQLGCEVHLADDGAKAVHMATHLDWDIILMDCSMPVMDGFEAVRRIRELDGPHASTCVVALTALSLAGDKRRCLDSGMDDYLQKLLRIAELRATLEHWLPEQPGQAA